MFCLGYDPGLALFLSETPPPAPRSGTDPAPTGFAASLLAGLARLTGRVMP